MERCPGAPPPAPPPVHAWRRGRLEVVGGQHGVQLPPLRTMAVHTEVCGCGGACVRAVSERGGTSSPASPPPHPPPMAHPRTWWEKTVKSALGEFLAATEPRSRAVALAFPSVHHHTRAQERRRVDWTPSTLCPHPPPPPSLLRLSPLARSAFLRITSFFNHNCTQRTTPTRPLCCAQPCSIQCVRGGADQTHHRD